MNEERVHLTTARNYSHSVTGDGANGDNDGDGLVVFSYSFHGITYSKEPYDTSPYL